MVAALDKRGGHGRGCVEGGGARQGTWHGQDGRIAVASLGHSAGPEVGTSTGVLLPLPRNRGDDYGDEYARMMRRVGGEHRATPDGERCPLASSAERQTWDNELGILEMQLTRLLEHDFIQIY